MKKFSVVSFIVLIMIMMVSVFMPVASMAGPSDTVVIYPISADPCMNPSTIKSSAVISATTATTVQLVALTASKSIYICELSSSMAGTTANATSFQLVSGTTTTTPCDTGQVNVSGSYGLATGTTNLNLHLGFGGTIMKVASSKALCSTQTGTNSAWTGTITYVKQ